MVSFVYGTNYDEFGKYLLRWMEHQTGRRLDHEDYKCIGVYRETILVGTIVYVTNTPTNLDLHVHIPKSLTERVIKEMFDYSFNVLKIERLTAKILSNNKAVENNLILLGFRLEAVLSDYYDKNIDQMIYVARKNNIEKWIN